RALSPAGGFPSRLDGGEEQGHQDADDSDDHQEFNEREGTGRPRTERGAHGKCSCSKGRNNAGTMRPAGRRNGSIPRPRTGRIGGGPAVARLGAGSLGASGPTSSKTRGAEEWTRGE